MVASVSALSVGQEAYHLGLAREDYYSAGGERPGRWHGRGAAALGLRGEVAAAALSNLFRGFSADGSAPLVRNAGSPARQPAWDVTFSAPKSVSVLWAIADPDVRRRVQVAHDRAVAAALDYLEAEAGFTRLGAGGVEREKVGLVVAAFQHGTSRAQDPQLHTHCLLLNVGVRADGTTGTIESRPVYRHKMAVGAVYRAELAAELERDLGLVTERRRAWFEVVGVPDGLVDGFSRRRKQIESALADRGLTGAAAAAVAALDTRNRKTVIPRAELFAGWAATGEAHGFGPAAARGLLARSPARDPGRELAAALAAAVDRLTAHHSHFARADLVRHAAEEAQGRGVGADAVRAGVDRLVRDELVSLGGGRGEYRFTTPGMLALERRLLDRVAGAAADTRPTVPQPVVDDVIAARPDLSAEQAAAVLHLTLAAGGVVVLSGLAGTGKTYVLDAAVDAWRRAGRTVVGCALSGKAAQGLGEATGVTTATLHRTLLDLDAGRLAVTPRTVVLVDEAGMVGTRMTERLVGAVLDAGGKVVLVGDARQLQPVEAGGPFAAIAARVGQAELTHVTRQRDGWFRAAVRAFADGDAAAALAPFVERGWVEVADDALAARRALVAAWAAAGGPDRPRDHLILAGTNADARHLNRLAQAELDAAGRRTGAALMVDGDEFRAGDRVLFTRNDRSLGVNNGHLGAVAAVDAAAGTLTVRLDGGRHVLVDPAAYPHVRLGAAVTTYKAQGMTVDHVYTLVGDGATDRELAYTQTSRARLTARFFVTPVATGDGLDDLVRRMGRSNRKGLALDVAGDGLRVGPVPELTVSREG